MYSLDELPDLVVSNILNYLELQDLLNLRLCSTSLYNIIRNFQSLAWKNCYTSIGVTSNLPHGKIDIKSLFCAGIRPCKIKVCNCLSNSFKYTSNIIRDLSNQSLNKNISYFEICSLDCSKQIDIDLINHLPNLSKLIIHFLECSTDSVKKLQFFLQKLQIIKIHTIHTKVEQRQPIIFYQNLQTFLQCFNSLTYVLIPYCHCNNEEEITTTRSYMLKIVKNYIIFRENLAIENKLESLFFDFKYITDPYEDIIDSGLKELAILILSNINCANVKIKNLNAEFLLELADEIENNNEFRLKNFLNQHLHSILNFEECIGHYSFNALKKLKITSSSHSADCDEWVTANMNIKMPNLRKISVCIDSAFPEKLYEILFIKTFHENVETFEIEIATKSEESFGLKMDKILYAFDKLNKLVMKNLPLESTTLVHLLPLFSKLLSISLEGKSTDTFCKLSPKILLDHLQNLKEIHLNLVNGYSLSTSFLTDFVAQLSLSQLELNFVLSPSKDITNMLYRLAEKQSIKIFKVSHL